jgi:hypothetical protein
MLDTEYFVNLRTGDILIQKGSVMMTMPMEQFLVYCQADQAMLYRLKNAGVDFEEYLLPYEIAMYKIRELGEGF